VIRDVAKKKKFGQLRSGTGNNTVFAQISWGWIEGMTRRTVERRTLISTPVAGSRSPRSTMPALPSRSRSCHCRPRRACETEDQLRDHGRVVDASTGVTSVR
jgi:hypothetical protein